MKYIIFDFDGTLAWLKVDWKAVRARIERSYGPIGNRTVFSWLQERYLKGLDVSGPMEMIRKAELGAVNDLDFDRELVELLRELRARGVRMALISMQDDDVLHRALKIMNAEGLFDVVVGRRTELSREKQLLRVLKEWGIKPGQAFFVSDRLEDMVLGLKMGLRALRLFYWDGSVKEWLRDLLGKAVNA